MRLLLVTHIYPPATDGGSKIVTKIGEYFKSNGHLVRVITTNCLTTDDFINPKATTIKQSELNIYRLPIYHLHRRLPKPLFKIIPIIKAIISIIKYQPNYIIAGPFPTTISLYALFLKIITRSKLIIIPCFHEFDRDFSHPSLIFTLRHADLICTLTHHESLILNTVHHLPNTKLYVMHAGIDRDFLLHDSKTKTSQKQQLLFLGNFAAHKRAELLIDAFAKVCQNYPNVRLTLSGQKTLYWPIIQRKIELLPDLIQSKITVNLKNYSSQELKQYLNAATILVLPSIHESFGLVFIESLARKVPVIGCNIPPVAELLKMSKGGVTFKKDDLYDLVAKIEAMLSDSKYRQKTATAGYDYVSKHLTWDTIGNRLWEKLQKC